MARKSIGFVPLVWECPFCETMNPGPIKTCTSCGAPQPDDVEFLQVDEEKFNFIKDEALIRMAKAGPDIHCPYCGTRNPSTAELCSNCGGEISLGGKARQTGKRVQTVADASEKAPPAEVEPKAKKGGKVAIFAIIGALAVIAGCIVLLMLLLRTDAVTATVTDVEWERRIAIEEYTTVTTSDWYDEIPPKAELISCSQKYRYTSEEPQANATEVCGEEYVEDTGTGVGEVFQDCVYEVYDEFCEYSTLDWIVVDTLIQSDDTLSPTWPALSLMNNQREGARTENYEITFTDNSETYTYTTTDSALFMMAEPGSNWKLEVNKLGGVQSIKPAN